MPEVRFPPRIGPVGQRTTKRSCEPHRRWVRKHRCSVRGCRQGPVECAHVRCGTDGGLGLKPSDLWTISLCCFHHQEQHQIGERTFELKYDLNLRALASEFARRSPHRMRLAEQNT